MDKAYNYVLEDTYSSNKPHLIEANSEKGNSSISQRKREQKVSDRNKTTRLEKGSSSENQRDQGKASNITWEDIVADEDDEENNILPVQEGSQEPLNKAISIYAI